jgi:two-component system, response regulator PdtaR
VVPSDRPTILLVEDEILVRLWTADELRDAGFRVVEAANADEALTRLHDGGPVDLLMTDIRMPGSMDGLGLARTVHAEWPGLKIVVASAHMQAAAGDTIDAFFGKPYDPAIVATRIRELLGRRQAAAALSPRSA